MQLSRCSFESQWRGSKGTDLQANVGDCKLVLFPEAALSDSQQIIAGRRRMAHDLLAQSFAQKIRPVGFNDDCGTSDSQPLLPRNAGRVPSPAALEQFDYGDVVLASGLHEKQLEETHSVLMGLSDDSLLKPFRQMSGQAAPGDD